MKMISFAVKKGGVGKTTLCKNVAYKFALDGAKVLVIDLNPQATLSVQFANNEIDINKSIMKIFQFFKFSIENIIQSTKYKNIDIILGNENINQAQGIINNTFNDKEKYKIGKCLLDDYKNIFDDYDYVLIDYPPTMQELALNFLIISDLIIMPINNGLGAFKGILDLNNIINKICRQENLKVPFYKIVFNNVKENDNTIEIYELINKNNLTNFIFDTIIKHSDTFIKTENKLNSIWDNNVYWRQKQAYEELIKEIK